ncbi:hypothetical protein GQR58_029601 [Nymphon striatum]|nr:hypothetical protein GQR58_029601 [Nymphon striatum]
MEAMGEPIALATNGTVREARGLTSISRSRVLDGELLRSSGRPRSGRGRGLRLIAELLDDVVGQGVWRQGTGTVTECDAASSMCCMMPATGRFRRVAERVDINLDRTGQILVEQNGAVAETTTARRCSVPTAPESRTISIARPPRTRRGGSPAGSRFRRLSRRLRRRNGPGPLCGCLRPSFAPTAGSVRGLRPSRLRQGMCRGSGCLRRPALARFSAGLAAELHDDTVQGAVFLLHAQDFHDVFKGKGFEILVGSVETDGSFHRLSHEGSEEFGRANHSDTASTTSDETPAAKSRTLECRRL